MGLKIWGAGWHPRRGDSRSGNDYADMPAGAVPTDGAGFRRFRGVPGGAVVLRGNFPRFEAVGFGRLCWPVGLSRLCFFCWGGGR